MVIWLVNVAGTLHSFLVANVETNFVFGVELPLALMFFQGEAYYISECELVLVSSVNLMFIIQCCIRGVAVFVAGKVVFDSNPMADCTVPGICAQHNGAMYHCGYIVYHGLN